MKREHFTVEEVRIDGYPMRCSDYRPDYRSQVCEDDLSSTLCDTSRKRKCCAALHCTVLAARSPLVEVLKPLAWN